MQNKVLDFINCEWTAAKASELLDVINPAAAAVIAQVVMTPKEVVAEAVDIAYQAYQEWRITPVLDRVQYLFKLKMLLEAHIDEIARIITNECGKTYKESLGEMQTFSKMGVDVLKLPFPVDHRQSQNLREWQAACEAVTQACYVPWALLSEGVNYETFVRQAKVACQAGASGVIVGRAVWAEAVELRGKNRQDFIQSVAIERMKTLSKLCGDYASPWYELVPAPDTSLNWYESQD